MEVRWSRAEDKEFENSLVRFPEGTPDRWLLISLQIPGKTAADVLRHYDALVRDLEAIEAGAVQLPDYDDDESDGGERARVSAKAVRREERRRGTPWTEDEHIRFLEGLRKYGKGDWRNIARNAVKTRTATQVASHAQKYFLRRQRAATKRSGGVGGGDHSSSTKRKSIHDITEESIVDITAQI